MILLRIAYIPRKGVGTFCIKPVVQKKLETNIGFICFFCPFLNSQIARLGKISLTTMEHPSAYVGQLAARIILDRIYNPDVTAVSTTIIEPRLVERDSVGRLS